MKNFLKENGWKLLGIVLIIFSIVAGLLIEVPELPVIRQSVRNLFFHVPMWFGMMAMFLFSFIRSLRYLSTFDQKHDNYAAELVNTGLFFGFLGMVTGMEWANFTWGKPWINDPQLTGAAVSLLAYLACVVLRSSIDEAGNRARIVAVYNIFAFVLLIVLIGVLPRLSGGSLHPGKAGSPLTIGSLSSGLQLVFYPAVTGWILIGCWIASIRVKIRYVKQHLDNQKYA